MNSSHPEKGGKDHKIRPFKPIELSNMYEVSKRTFNKWLKPFAQLIGKKNGQFYTILQVKKIFKFLGPPEGYENYED